VPETPASVIKIGISSCLLGEMVRFDGGHKRDDFLTETFGRFVSFVPVCPEVELGLGTPRETLRLVGSAETARLVTTKTAIDHTQAMDAWARERLEGLAGEGLSGYVLKKDSPSCGMERVKVYGGSGPAARNGRGIYAARLLARFPLLPVEEEGRLHDPWLRENFVERVFAYRRVEDFFAARWTMGQLVLFHTAQKLLLLAHEPKAYEKLGRLVAGAKGQPRHEVASEYKECFMKALAKLAKARQHVNVLQHMAGYFKKLLSAADRQELVQIIDDYGKGLVPLVVPLTLLRHHVRVHGVSYLAGQVYLEPHPKELMLRNHA